jgi:hypothetical protein
MESKQMNPAESLDLIHSMINTAKNRLADDGFFFIFWGWLVFAASLLNYISIILQSDWGYLVWPVLLPLGGVYSIFYSRKQNKKEKVSSYIDTYLGYAWTAFGIGMSLTLILMPYHGIKITYFFLTVLYGMATLISGGLLAFRPLVIGSFFSFLLAILSTFMPEREQFLIISLALLCSYIIPGHMLRSKFKSQL